MKWGIGAVLLACMCSAELGYAQTRDATEAIGTGDQSGGEQISEQEARDFFDRLRDAVQRRDAETFVSLLADEFVRIVEENGATREISRDDSVRKMRVYLSSEFSSDIDVRHVTVIGSTATIQYAYHQKTVTETGQTLEKKSMRAMTIKKIGGVPKVVELYELVLDRTAR